MADLEENDWNIDDKLREAEGRRIEKGQVFMLDQNRATCEGVRNFR